jgi:cation diffusion facilitator family transporter
VPLPYLQKLALGSIAVGLLVLGLKLLAWWMTGSVALLSDALESTVNLATAVATLIAVRIAAAPADARHPYGHHKAELFAAILEGAMIALAAALILKEAAEAVFQPRMPDITGAALALTVAASAINAVWCAVLIREGRLRRSPALVADGRHLLTDVISSIGVLAGLLLALATGWHLIDPIAASLVALNILWSGSRIIRESVSGLMDEALPDDQIADLRRLIATHAEGAVEVHDLRTRHAGAATFIDFHLVVAGDLPVRAAHDICDRIEAAVKADIPGAVLTIHVEPENKAKHSGVLVI